MKDKKPSLRKTPLMRVVAHYAMTAEQESGFNKATDMLLAELVRSLDRRNEGEGYGSTEKQMAGKAGDRRRPTEQ